MGKGIIYLIGDSNNEGYYKIGVTRGNIDKRIKKLQTGNSGEIFLVDKYESEFPFFVEKWMHKKYNNNRLVGEWYELTEDDVGSFKDNCKLYEDIVSTLEDNPFFKKMILNSLKNLKMQ